MQYEEQILACTMQENVLLDSLCIHEYKAMPYKSLKIIMKSNPAFSKSSTLGKL